MQKNLNKKSRVTFLLNLVSAKMKAKISATVYHSKICSGSSIQEVKSWKSCLGRPTLKSCPGSPILAIMYWQVCPGRSVLAVCSGISDLHAIIFLSCFACPIWAVLFRLFFSGCHVSSYPVCLSCYKRPVLAVLS
jgi:hypothetical protein